MESGVIFEDNLNFRQQISIACNSCFYLMRGLHRYLSLSVTKTVSLIFSPSNTTEISTLDSCRISFLRICTHTYQVLSSIQTDYLHLLLIRAKKARQLRSPNSHLLFVPRFQTNIESSYFSVSHLLSGTHSLIM